MWDKRSTYISNHDGDTITMRLDQGFHDEKVIDVRLLGVYAPELKDDGGADCREEVKSWFAKNNPNLLPWQFIVTTARLKNNTSEITTLERYVATVTTLDGSDNLNLHMIDYIRSKGYGGGTGAPK